LYLADEGPLPGVGRSPSPESGSTSVLLLCNTST